MVKKKSKVLFLFYVVLIFYTIFYIFFLGGYLDKEIQDRVTLTEENMKKFEMDVDNGLDVTITDYLTLDKKDYNTNITRLGNKLAASIEYIVKDGIKIMVSTIKKLFT